MRKNIISNLVAFAGAVALSGCLGGAPTGGTGTGTGTGTGDGTGSGTGSGTGTGTGDGTTTPKPDPNLTARQIDYGQALRTAAVKLVGALPSLDEQAAVTDATTYAAQIDKYLADPRFALQIKSYYSDMMKMGGSLKATVGQTMVTVSLDTAPTYAAELVVKDQDITNLFTATTNTCPTLSADGATFTDAVCPVANGLKTAGVLTDPGAMAQFYSNMSFRRVRWIQESFACTKFPAEYSAKPVAMGNGQYTSPWPFMSISGGTTAPINFLDVGSAICANCHGTMNHFAPLFANFDPAGAYQTTIQVHTPTPASPISKLSDWLPATETFTWRYGNAAVTDISGLGAQIAADPAVQKCQVQRAWNWAMSKTDIVNDLAVVPDSTIKDVMSVFTSSGMKMKPTLKAIFTDPNFVMF
ncbi:MAG: hypothetical protein ACXVCV_00680 [Polyangia bacterium]